MSIGERVRISLVVTAALLKDGRRCVNGAVENSGRTVKISVMVYGVLHNYLKMVLLK
jgi:hypothetical protein